LGQALAQSHSFDLDIDSVVFQIGFPFTAGKRRFYNLTIFVCLPEGIESVSQSVPGPMLLKLAVEVIRYRL